MNNYSKSKKNNLDIFFEDYWCIRKHIKNMNFREVYIFTKYLLLLLFIYFIINIFFFIF